MVVTPGTGEPDTGTSRSRARAACVGAGDRPQSGGDPAPAVRGLKPPRAGAALPAASLSDAGLLLPSPPALRAQGPLSFCREDPSPPAEVEGKDLALVEPEGGGACSPTSHVDGVGGGYAPGRGHTGGGVGRRVPPARQGQLCCDASQALQPHCGRHAGALAEVPPRGTGTWSQPWRPRLQLNWAE